MRSPWRKGGSRRPRHHDASPAKRGFGMVFQHSHGDPHARRGQRGIRSGSSWHGQGKRLERARSALLSVGLGNADRGVQSLSGGEQQRVALARALVIEPQVLLLDEPLSIWIRLCARQPATICAPCSVGVSALFVTHDQEDAFAIADHIAVIRKESCFRWGLRRICTTDRPRSALRDSSGGRRSSPAVAGSSGGA